MYLLFLWRCECHLGPKKSRFSGPTPSNAPSNDVAPLKTIKYKRHKNNWTGTLVVLCTRVLLYSVCSAQTRTGIGLLGKPPAVKQFPPSKATRCMRLLPDPEQTQVWSEQVWLNTTFISQGSLLWDKLAVET
jgi:hypothetical protein